MFAALDATGWSVVIAALFLGFGQIVSMILSHLREQAKIERDKIVAAKVEQVAVKTVEAAKEVKEVKATLEERGVRQDEQLTTIHTLVNSQRGQTLRMLAVTARAKAVITQDAKDLAAATEAEQEYADHELKQSRADAI